MNWKKTQIILRRVLFLVLVAVVLMYTAAVFERKTVSGAWNYSIKVGGYRNEPEQTFDVVGIGSSHMYCTLNPLRLYEQTGLRSYVLATQQQPPVASYYYAKEAFRNQSPDVLLIEALMFTKDNSNVSDGVAHDAIDPLPNSINKLRLIWEMRTQEKKETYFLNFTKYHSRWKELTAADFDFSYRTKTDPFHGYVFLTHVGESQFSPVSYDGAGETVLPEENLMYLLKLQALAEENGATLVLLFAPATLTEGQIGDYNALHRFAREHGIPTLDLNLEGQAPALDVTTDFYDAGHLNVYGAEKATDAIGLYLLDAGLTEPKARDDEGLWQADLEFYRTSRAEAESGS